MKSKTNKARILRLLLVATVFLLQSLSAQRTIRMNLEQLVKDAGIILRGTVTAVESRPDKQTGYRATFVTLRVDENFYGAPNGEITFKVYAGRSGALKLADMPKFAVGEESYSLWYSPSKAGFSSPVGMLQGKFSVREDATSGKQTVLNGVANKSLFKGIKNRSALARAAWTEGAETLVEPADFDATLRSLVSILKGK